MTMTTPRPVSEFLELLNAQTARPRVQKVPELGFEMAQMFDRVVFAKDDMSTSEAFATLADEQQPDDGEMVDDTWQHAFDTLDDEDAAYDPRNDPDLPGWGTAIQWSDLHHLTITYEFAD